MRHIILGKFEQLYVSFANSILVKYSLQKWRILLRGDGFSVRTQPPFMLLDEFGEQLKFVEVGFGVMLPELLSGYRSIDLTRKVREELTLQIVHIFLKLGPGQASFLFLQLPNILRFDREEDAHEVPCNFIPLAMCSSGRGTISLSKGYSLNSRTAISVGHMLQSFITFLLLFIRCEQFGQPCFRLLLDFDCFGYFRQQGKRLDQFCYCFHLMEMFIIWEVN